MGDPQVQEELKAEWQKEKDQIENVLKKAEDQEIFKDIDRFLKVYKKLESYLEV